MKPRKPYKFGGKELISENGINEYDFGARRYWSAVPQFTSVDPLSEKFKWLSPYLYCANNPVNFTDPTGEELVCEVLLAMDNIRYTLEPIEASFVRFVNCKIDAVLLNQCKSSSVNMTALQTVVNSETTFYVATASEYKRANGESRKMKSEEDKEGTIGVTMMPGVEGEDTSPDGNVYIYTSNQISKSEQVENTAHELYGHAYFFERKQQGHDVNPSHVYESIYIEGGVVDGCNCRDIELIRVDINIPLWKQINKLTSSAKNNYIKTK